jgi:hypothetical protein
MEPAQAAVVTQAPVTAPAAEVVVAPTAPRHEKKHEPRHDRNPHKKREPEHRASHDRKNDAKSVKPERHELPAFLFRPVNLPKKADAEG